MAYRPILEPAFIIGPPHMYVAAAEVPDKEDGFISIIIGAGIGKFFDLASKTEHVEFANKYWEYLDEVEAATPGIAELNHAQCRVREIFRATDGVEQKLIAVKIEEAAEDNAKDCETRNGRK